MQYRKLGKTGRELSVIGFGGIVVMNETPESAARLVAAAINRGITYFDVAPSYGDAEVKLGPALKPFRKDVFLACKTQKRDAAGAAKELENSLKVLETDYLDLYQFHAVTTEEDVEKILAPGGALETVVAAKEAGKIRHVGFSTHGESAAVKLLDAYQFDSVLVPINYACWQSGHFGPQTFEKAQEQGIGILALKALAKGRWEKGEKKTWPKCWYRPVDTLPEAREALAFTLSKPVTAAVSPSHADLLWLACEALDSLENEPVETPAVTDMAGTPIFTTDVAG